MGFSIVQVQGRLALTDDAGNVIGVFDDAGDKRLQVQALLKAGHGLSTEATLALIKAKTDNLDVALSTRAITGLTDAQLRAAAVPVTANQGAPAAAASAWPTTNTDGTNTASVFPATFLRTTDEPRQLFYDPFDATLDTINRWSAPTTSGGAVGAAVSAGVLTLSTGTTANGQTSLQSQPSFIPTIPAWLGVSFALKIPNPVVLNQYFFWGVGTSPGSPTTTAPLTDAYGFELATDGKMYAVVYIAGVRNVVQDLSAATGNAKQPTDANHHRYIVFYRTDRTFFYIDSIAPSGLVGSTSFVSPAVQVLPVKLAAIAGAVAPLSSGTLSVTGLAVWDTGKNNTTLSDGVFGFRKATIKGASAIPAATDTALVVVLSPNQQAIPVTTAPASSVSGNRVGYVVLGGGSLGSFNALRGTTYNEQVTNAVRSVASSDINDTALGTGARTIEITYYTQVCAGPFTATVTLNGTTPVATVAADICFIESIVVKTAGSNGANIGTLTLYVNNIGGGGVIGTIGVGTLVVAVGDNRTLWAHHYVPSGKITSVTAYLGGSSSGTSTSFLLRSKDPTSVNSPEVILTSGIIATSSQFSRTLGSPISIPGPARITLFGIPAANNATLNGAFDFYET